MASPAVTRIRPLVKRAVVRTFRQPPVVVQGIVFPLFLYAFMVGGLGKAVKHIPGFPATSYTTFALGLTFAYCAVFAPVVAGAPLGEDIRRGFATRIALTSTSGVALVFAQLAGTVGFAAFQAVVFLAIGLGVGASLAAGAGGAVVMVLLAMFSALTFGSVGLFIAQRTRSPEAVQGLLPLLTAAMFFSSLSLPRNLIAVDWFRDVATYNPLSYLIEAERSLLITGWEGTALVKGFGILAGILVLAVAATVVSMRRVSVAR